MLRLFTKLSTVTTFSSVHRKMTWGSLSMRSMRDRHLSSLFSLSLCEQLVCQWDHAFDSTRLGKPGTTGLGDVQLKRDLFEAPLPVLAILDEALPCSVV